jgi:FkbM family methyltransferase
MNKNNTYENLKGLGFNPNVIVDCGAAWGDWTRMVNRLFPESFIISVDANKWTDGQIPGSSVTEISVLSDEDNKEMIFYRKKESIEGGTFCTGDSLFKEQTQHYSYNNTIEDKVLTTTLKTILNKHNKSKIDLLKIDTQGSELIIMKGLGDTLQNVEFIELECSIIEYNIDGCVFTDIVEFLKNDFEIFDIVDLQYHYGFLAHIDVIFKNKKSKIIKPL